MSRNLCWSAALGWHVELDTVDLWWQQACSDCVNRVLLVCAERTLGQASCWRPWTSLSAYLAAMQVICTLHVHVCLQT